MRLRYPGSIVTAILISAALAVPVNSGQVRVNVGQGGNLFVPRAININPGDHAVWVANALSLIPHTSTSGDSSLPTPDGKWDSGPLAGAVTNNGAAFSWKSATASTNRYYCTPHAPIMAGRVIVSSSPVSVSDFRITEVLYNDPAGHDLIEITNMGAAVGDFGRYRLSVQSGVQVGLAPNTITVPVGETITIHVNASGTNTMNDIFVPTLPALPTSGSVALYVPNTVNTALTAVDQIIDFVQWGASGGPNEATAVAASFWTGGEFTSGGATAGHSIEFCGTAAQHGASRWYDNPTPNFSGGADNCAVPVISTTWGRIKAIYR